MSLQLMKERIKCTGITPREEMIHDGQNLLKEELEHDSSYSPTVYFYDPVSEKDDRPAKLRIYNRKFSSLNGNYQNFLTTYDNPIKIGEYIHDTKDDTYWLVYNSFNVNDIHYEGKLIQCNYLLRWQLSDGTIVERHANIVSASKYDTGTTGNSVIVLSSNNYTILIGYCEEGFELENKRVFIDMKPNNPTKVFKMTRADDVIYNSDGIGRILGFIADKTELNLTTDRPNLRLCDYIDPTTSLPPHQDDPDETTVSTTSHITYKGSAELKIGGNYKSITGYFKDKEGNQTSDIGKWEVITIDEILPYLQYTITDNVLKIKVLDNDFATRGIVRIQFSNKSESISTYLDFNIISSF